MLPRKPKRTRDIYMNSLKFLEFRLTCRFSLYHVQVNFHSTQAKVNASLDDKVSSTESRGGFDRFQSLLSSLGVSPSLKDVDIRQ